ncbi:Gfo/Idh/MocA family oxidoreductase [Paenibacillus cymbidii]|uniref:Gfo/Idh/MocA family oxidoreductase n=1 Tax=Paenibacillus cymbidii TaxID=1639034 RepID=UPI00108217A9|nr:Gfo/Idh/MocA family oxidoreductase [Paenibacillus cymbidii]
MANDLRLAMLGKVEGNGHPYSWSVIFNGYHSEELEKCPYHVIRDYLRKEPKDKLQIEGARVTHIWTDDPEDALRVAATAFIPHVVQRPEDVIGHVDAVIIPTGEGQAERCRPFVEAGIPVFADKPLADNETDLRQFIQWRKEGKRILSSSCMRYCKEFMPYRASVHNLGKIRFASVTTPKSWERYGIHALEAIYPIVGAGFLSVRNLGDATRNLVHLKHGSGADIVISAVDDMFGAFGMLQLCGTEDYAVAAMKDTFYCFKAQLQSFVDYVRTGVDPYPFEETIELMKLVIAGIRSRETGGREIFIDDMLV